MEADDLVLGMLDARLKRIEDRLDQLAAKPTHCELHAEKLLQLERRTKALEHIAGKQATVAATLGAIGAAVALLVRYIIEGVNK